MATKKATAQQQKEKREKIVLGVLLAVLVVVVIVEAPKFMSSGGTPAAAPATATTAGGASLAVAPTAAPAAPGQLKRLVGFAAKDPFKSQVQMPVAGATPPAGTTPATTPVKVPKTSPVVVKVTPQKVAQVPTGPMVPAALIMLNGKRKVIPLNGTFPEKNPLFRLVGIGPKEISLRLIGGSLSGGEQIFKLRKGHPLRLVNQTAGTHFVLAMLRPTTAPKPAEVITPAASVTVPAAPTTTGPIIGSPSTTTTG